MPHTQKPTNVWDGVPLLLFVVLVVGLIVAWFALTDSPLVHLCDQCHRPMQQGKRG